MILQVVFRHRSTGAFQPGHRQKIQMSPHRGHRSTVHPTWWKPPGFTLQDGHRRSAGWKTVFGFAG